MGWHWYLQVTSLGVLHDDAEAVIIDEGVLVRDYVGAVDRCQDTHFVQCVLLLLVFEQVESHLLQSVLFVVGEAMHLVYAAVGTLADLAEHAKVCE